MYFPAGRGVFPVQHQWTEFRLIPYFFQLKVVYQQLMTQYVTSHLHVKDYFLPGLFDPESFICKGSTRTGFQIFLKGRSFAIINESMKGDKFPGEKFGSMGGLAGVVGGESLVNIGGQANISLIRMGNTLEEVDVLHQHLLNCPISAESPPSP
jgi:hypothetical protein